MAEWESSTIWDTDEEPEEFELDAEARARRDAVTRQVRKFGDPVLRSRALVVEKFDVELGQEIERMKRVVIDGLAYGVAGPQMGVLHRLFVYHMEPEEPIVVVANPVIEWASPEKDIMEEACLSLPGIAVPVERSLEIRVSAQNERGEPFTIEAQGMRARVIQHESDHLDGVLTIDRTTREARKEALRALRELIA